MLKQTTEKILSLIHGKGDPAGQPARLREDCSTEEILSELSIKFTGQALCDNQLSQLIDLIKKKSVHTDHGFFMNQMFGKQLPIAVLGDLLTVLLNTSMYTYEVAPVLTLIENECVKRLGSCIWNSNESCDGIFTPGSSISNMMAMMLARDAKFPQAGALGLFDVPPFRIFVSDQVHYSFKKGALFSGMGKRILVEVKSDSDGKISTPALQNAIENELQNGNVPLMLIGIAGTTVSGVYDDLESLAQVAARHGMWFHADAAFGGSLLFSQKEKHKLKGIEHADSVSWSLHKMMGIPLSCAVLLTKNSHVLRKAFAIDAEYLFHGNEMDLGQKSLQCGRRADALKLWMAWKSEGDAGFEERVDKLINIAKRFAKIISENSNLELLCVPESPIVCFRFVHPDLLPKKTDDLNQLIRENLFSEGYLLFNYSIHKDRTYLRCVFSDPDMDDLSLTFILDRICSTGSRIAGHALVASGMNQLQQWA